MILVLIVSPIAITRYLLKNKDKLDSKEMDKFIGNAYRMTNFREKKSSLWYPFMFLTRRLLFVFVPLAMWRIPNLQIHVLFVISEAYILVLGILEPVKCKNHKRLEYINEVAVMFMNYHMVCFSGFVINDEVKFQIGDSFFYLLVLTIFVNILDLVISESGKKRSMKSHQKKESSKKSEFMKDFIDRYEIENKDKFFEEIMEQKLERPLEVVEEHTEFEAEDLDPTDFQPELS